MAGRAAWCLEDSFLGDRRQVPQKHRHIIQETRIADRPECEQTEIGDMIQLFKLVRGLEGSFFQTNYDGYIGEYLPGKFGRLIDLQFLSKPLGGPSSRHFFPSKRATYHADFVTPACVDHEISKLEVQLQYHNKPLGSKV
ncbi:hypothetical protein Bbelb_072830 [Branchiostoma belcheri]|nr:hypothetical protein Bbelb_072830 [Branchiostoma belcheri]